MINEKNLKKMCVGMKKKQNGMALINNVSMLSGKKNGLIYNVGITKGRKMTKSQAMYLKKNKGTKRFWDTDKDGVIDGLDCWYKNKRKHDDGEEYEVDYKDSPNSFDIQERAKKPLNEAEESNNKALEAIDDEIDEPDEQLAANTGDVLDDAEFEYDTEVEGSQIRPKYSVESFDVEEQDYKPERKPTSTENFKTYLKEGIEYRKEQARRGLSKASMYAFETPEKRKEYIQEDKEKELQRAKYQAASMGVDKTTIDTIGKFGFSPQKESQILRDRAIKARDINRRKSAKDKLSVISYNLAVQKSRAAYSKQQQGLGTNIGFLSFGKQPIVKKKGKNQPRQSSSFNSMEFL